MTHSESERDEDTASDGTYCSSAEADTNDSCSVDGDSEARGNLLRFHGLFIVHDNGFSD